MDRCEFEKLYFGYRIEELTTGCVCLFPRSESLGPCALEIPSYKLLSGLEPRDYTRALPDVDGFLRREMQISSSDSAVNDLRWEYFVRFGMMLPVEIGGCKVLKILPAEQAEVMQVIMRTCKLRLDYSWEMDVGVKDGTLLEWECVDDAIHRYLFANIAMSHEMFELRRVFRKAWLDIINPQPRAPRRYYNAWLNGVDFR